jgi:hypothetical protein
MISDRLSNLYFSTLLLGQLLSNDLGPMLVEPFVPTAMYFYEAELAQRNSLWYRGLCLTGLVLKSRKTFGEEK